MTFHSQQTPRVIPLSPPPYPRKSFADLFRSGMAPPEMPIEIPANLVEFKESQQTDDLPFEIEAFKCALLKSQNDMHIAKDQAAKNIADDMANIKRQHR